MNYEYCGEPWGYCEPPCSLENGMCQGCEIKNQAIRITELVTAIEEHKTACTKLSKVPKYRHRKLWSVLGVKL